MRRKNERSKQTRHSKTKKIISCLLVFVIMVGIINVIPAFASPPKEPPIFYEEDYMGYSKPADPNNPDEYSYQLYVRNRSEARVSYCYNAHKQFPPPDDSFDDEYLSNYFYFRPAKMDKPIEGPVIKAIYNGYPYNASNLKGNMTDNQFRAVTQAAIWYLHDNLPLEGNRNNNAIYKLNFNGQGKFVFTAEMKDVFRKITAQTDFQLKQPPENLWLKCFEPRTKGDYYDVQNLLTTSETSPDEDPINAAEIQIEAQKRLDGESTNIPEIFEFELITPKGKVIETVKNGADGSVKFRKFYLIQEGEFIFTIKEKVLADSNYSYDETKYKAKITVTKNDNNEALSAKIEYLDNNNRPIESLPTFKNLNLSKTIDIPVTKEWIGKPANEVKVKLLADDVQKEEVILNQENNWNHTFTGLPVYDSNDHHEIEYTIFEEPLEGYKSNISGDMHSGFKITNKITGQISIPVTKQWVGTAGESAVINLIADGSKVDTVTLNKDNKWQHTFKDLEKYDSEDGHEIEYKVTEDTVDGYITNISGSPENGFTITNTITGKLSIPVTKNWIGTPAKSVNISLLADNTVVNTVTLNAENNWQHTFTDLQKYDSKDGHEIVYTISEVAVDGYKTEIIGDAQNGFIVTNTITGTTSFPVTKKWIGPAGNAAVINLKADGNIIETITLNAENNWYHKFADLPKYDSKDGHEIIYTITEDEIEGYTTNISGDVQNGFTVTNTITGTTSVSVNKKWIGPATESVTINLVADGNEVDRIVLNEKNNWQHTFADLPKYDSKDGHEIVYTITEDALADYKTEISGDAQNGFTVTNTVAIQTSIPVTKQWVGVAADSATINLIADGKVIDTVTLNADNNWYHQFTALPKYDSADGHEIKYSITENHIEGYTTNIVGDAESGFIITNTKDKAPEPEPEPEPKPDPNPAKVNFEVLKTLDGQTPASDLFSFELKDDKNNLIQTKKNQDNKITFDTLTFSNVGTYKYYISEVKGKDGSIIYDSTVFEATVDVTLNDNYEATVTYKKDGKPLEGVATFENKTKVLPSLTVIKEWDDNNNTTDRPYFVKVQLYKDNMPFGEPVVLNEENNWQYTFKDLDENAKWTVDEIDVPDNYKKSVKNDGNTWTITNKLKRHIPLVPDINAPHTGNDILIAILTFILVVSICTSATIIYNKNRKYKRPNKK